MNNSFSTGLFEPDENNCDKHTQNHLVVSPAVAKELKDMYPVNLNDIAMELSKKYLKTEENNDS